MQNFRNLEAGEITQVLLPQICCSFGRPNLWHGGCLATLRSDRLRRRGTQRKPLTLVDEMIFELGSTLQFASIRCFHGCKVPVFFLKDYDQRRRLQMQSNSVQTPNYSIRSSTTSTVCFGLTVDDC